MIDYYDLLQISPNAETETVHRVYHFLAARFHPDNKESGNAGMFRLLKLAHDVLTNKARRAEYDASHIRVMPKPLSTSIDFMDNLEGELNRRLAVLAVLYHRRRTSPNMPEVTLYELEERMGFPRDYLDFTLWYLQKKNYITKADNAVYALTAEGVDFVEHERAKIPVLNKLLTSSTESSSEAVAKAIDELEEGIMVPDAEPAGPIILPQTHEPVLDQRTGLKDRRVGAPDLRIFKTERRGQVKDRRSGKSSDRRRKPN